MTTEPISQPNEVSSVSPSSPPQPMYSQPVPNNKATYIGIAVITALALVIGYQQMQISRLNNDISIVTGDVRSGETRGHLEAVDAKLQEMNTRLTYLDSKINTADQKAQSALDKIKTQEEKADWFGNMMKGFGWKK